MKAEDGSQKTVFRTHESEVTADQVEIAVYVMLADSGL